MEQGMCKRCNKIFKKTSKGSKICVWCNLNKYPKHKQKAQKIKSQLYQAVVDNEGKFLGFVTGDETIELKMTAKVMKHKQYGYVFRGTA